MRFAHFLAVLAFAAAALAGADANAQRNAQPTAQLRVTTTPAERFRARPANERAAAARQLAGQLRITINEDYLNSPFSLTPRTPDVNGRGWIGVRQLQYWHARVPPDLANQPWAGDTGVILLTSTYGELTLHLANAEAHRFLLDCTVDGAVQVRMRTSSGATANFSAQNTTVFSLVTAPGDDAVAISASGAWRFLGCEITRLQ